MGIHVVNDWQLYVHQEFEKVFEDLIKLVENQKKNDPENYTNSLQYKRLKHITRLILTDIPQNPNRRQYYLKKELKQLRRAKYLGRYRLLFLFQGTGKLICYIWTNDRKDSQKGRFKK